MDYFKKILNEYSWKEIKIQVLSDWSEAESKWWKQYSYTIGYNGVEYIHYMDARSKVLWIFKKNFHLVWIKTKNPVNWDDFYWKWSLDEEKQKKQNEETPIDKVDNRKFDRNTLKRDLSILAQSILHIYWYYNPDISFEDNAKTAINDCTIFNRLIEEKVEMMSMMNWLDDRDLSKRQF